ncbi:MAG: PAC2 family protein [SAR202 cluster bacterium]|nr:PAC2 family protein [SAR202 cluster bacterium]
MEGLITHEAPDVKLPTMIVAFAGWPDAAEAATRALRYLVRKLPAKKFAEIDPEEFYDFTSVRPQTRINRRGERIIRWPRNDFYYFAPQHQENGLLLYVGTEPNLRWRAFSNIISTVATDHGVKLVVTLGALLDAVPHTREPRVTGRASSPELTEKVKWLGIQNSGYQGPTGIHTAFLDSCNETGLPHASIWGHCPHYVNTSPNPRVSCSMLTKLRSMVDFDVDLHELRLAGDAFETEVSKAIAKQPDVSSYVTRLEQRYDATHPVEEDIPSPDDMVRELEDFLKSQRKPPDS